MMSDEVRGVYSKYTVIKESTGEVLDDCFVLRPAKDEHARAALLAYARSCEFDNPVLHAELLAWLNYIAQ